MTLAHEPLSPVTSAVSLGCSTVSALALVASVFLGPVLLVVSWPLLVLALLLAIIELGRSERIRSSSSLPRWSAALGLLVLAASIAWCVALFGIPLT